MIQHRLALAGVLGLALAACQRPTNDTNIAIDNDVNAAEVAGADVQTIPPSETSVSPAGSRTGAASNAQSQTPAVIPAQYRGRWGMVPADCTSTRGDAKGLIMIGESSIRFYESTATLKEQRPAIATSFSGTYGFTGEGQTWEKVVTLTRTGDMLRRADDEGAYSYTRC